jgi:hypothetical protein
MITYFKERFYEYGLGLSLNEIKRIYKKLFPKDFSGFSFEDFINHLGIKNNLIPRKNKEFLKLCDIFIDVISLGYKYKNVRYNKLIRVSLYSSIIESLIDLTERKISANERFYEFFENYLDKQTIAELKNKIFITYKKEDYESEFLAEKEDYKKIEDTKYFCEILYGYFRCCTSHTLKLIPIQDRTKTGTLYVGWGSFYNRKEKDKKKKLCFIRTENFSLNDFEKIIKIGLKNFIKSSREENKTNLANLS